MGLHIGLPVRAAILAGASASMLTGCFVSPGKFASELELMKDGSFAYSYDGEIQMVALSKLAEMMAKQDESEFAAYCWGEDTGEDRDCTEAEIAEQRADWDANADERAAEKAREAEMMKAMLGGIDPANPEAAHEFASKLERQQGWSSVEYLGDGLFDVDFRISGRLTHGFTFPLIEKLTLSNSFVTVILRDDNQVRIDAPGFLPPKGNSPIPGLSGLAGLAAMGAMQEGENAPRIAIPEGRFTIVTNGRILANNTDEGPADHSRGQALVWDVTPRSEAAPTALIALGE